LICVTYFHFTTSMWTASLCIYLYVVKVVYTTCVRVRCQQRRGHWEFTPGPLSVQHLTHDMYICLYLLGTINGSKLLVNTQVIEFQLKNKWTNKSLFAFVFHGFYNFSHNIFCLYSNHVWKTDWLLYTKQFHKNYKTSLEHVK